MIFLSVRLDKSQNEKIQNAIESGDFKNKSAFIREAINQFGNDENIQKTIALFTRPMAPPPSQREQFLTIGDYTQAQRLKFLQSTMLEPSAENLEIAWKVSVECQAVVHTVVQSIQKGTTKIVIEPENYSQAKRIKEILETMLDNIDYHDFVEEIIVALSKYGNAIFNVQVKESGVNYELIEVGLIDFKNVKPTRHPFFPWFKFVYKTFVDKSMPENFERFLTFLPTGEFSEYKTYHLFPLEYTLKDRNSFDMVQREWMAQQKEIHHCIHTKYRGSGYEIGESPLGLVLNKIVSKLLLEYYAPLVAEIYGNPRLIAENEPIIIQTNEGTIVLNAPQTKDEEKEFEAKMKELADELKNLKGMGVIISPLGWKTRFETPSSGIFNFPELLRYLKGEIMLAFLASLSLFDITEAHALAASKTLKSVWDDMIDSFRRKIEKTFEQQIFPFCLILAGIEPDNLECKIKFQISPYVIPFADVAEAIGLVNTGLLLVDEWRERHNLPPLEEQIVEPPEPETIDELITTEPEMDLISPPEEPEETEEAE